MYHKHKKRIPRRKPDPIPEYTCPVIIGQLSGRKYLQHDGHLWEVIAESRAGSSARYVLTKGDEMCVIREFHGERTEEERWYTA